MTAVTNLTNAKKKLEKLRRTGLSDARSDYPNTPSIGLTDAGRRTNSDRIQDSVQKLLCNRMIRSVKTRSVELIIGVFCREHVWGIKALPSGSVDPT